MVAGVPVGMDAREKSARAQRPKAPSDQKSAVSSPESQPPRLSFTAAEKRTPDPRSAGASAQPHWSTTVCSKRETELVRRRSAAAWHEPSAAAGAGMAAGRTGAVEPTQALRLKASEVAKAIAMPMMFGF